MKIAILHSGDLNKISPGGISQYIEKIIKYDVEDEITLIGTTDINSDFIINKIYNRKVEDKEYLFLPISDNAKRPLSLYYFMKIFKNFKKLKEYDVIYAQRMEYAIPFIFSKQRAKVIMAVHGSGMYSYIFWGKLIGTIYNYAERIAIRASSKVVILLKREEFGIPYYKKKFNKQKDKFSYGKVPIDTKIFRKMDKSIVREELSIEKEMKIILYFGRLDNNPKRIMLLPSIIKKLKKNNNVKCIVIGNGSDKESLIEAIDNNKLKENFILINSLEHGESLTKYINCADISVILSTFEGICMSALESLACGVPVIATDVGDAKEYIYNNINGVVVKNNDNDSVVDSMAYYIEKHFEEQYISLDDKYKEYSANEWIKELKDIFNKVGMVKRID